ncbi:chemotaxis protein CheW [Roseixanthobacter glucoisosaccharinicivorans]|uniref:chemotaxis protein CheW n=1 Tax=Roseixanthobacter glucoisosaccharinicivorans TaxID=3119923 RepID=UPI0037288E69
MADRMQPASEPGGGRRRFLTFRSGGDLYALPVEMVSEIISVPQLARVPMAPKSLLGIGNLRGTAMPVASLRGLLEREAGHAPPSSIAIVLHGAAPVALTVDRVEALVMVEVDGIETRQAELAAAPGERLHGAFPYAAGGDGAVAKILDVAGLIASTFAQRPSARGPDRARSRAEPDLQHAREGGEGTAQRGRMVTFEVAGQDYALALEDAREVVPVPQRFALMPRAEAQVLGMMSYRDTLLPLFSLRGLLGLPEGERDGREKVVVTSVHGALVGLMVDRIRSVLPVDPDLLEPVPAVLAARTGGETRIRSIYRADAGRRLISVLAPEQLFKEDIMQRLAAGYAASAPGAEAGAEDEKALHYLVFRLGENEFGLPVEAVDEVAAVPARLTRVPKTPAFLEGVVNLRGEVLPVVDQRRRFGMPPLETGATRRLVVTRTARHRAGLIVDAVSQVLRTSQDRIEPAPDLAGEETRLVHGVVNLPQDGRMVLLLDPQELLTRTEQGLLDTFARRQGAR